ncbi:MAG: serine hydrolase [Gemmatimonadota bacterium]|nr:serine hydrolase [Gemmatimonadota bacterium]MDH4350186.1 serine hydrolase [Gemmatimonadota bacterium]
MGPRLLLATSLLLATVTSLVAQRAPDLRALDTYIAQARADWRVPGLAVAIVKDGRIVFEKGYGVRHRFDGGTVDAHTLFAIASNTKAFTSAAIALLVEEGKLDWDTRVVEILPWFQVADPYVTREMRVRDLLSHRSGFGTYSGDLLWYGTSYSAEEVVRRLRYLEPALGFREGYRYSNLMFITAGEVIAAASGMRWDAFVRTRILAPLAMTETVTSVAQLAGVTNVATPHGEKADTIRPFPWESWDAMGSAGAIISNVHDMAQWLMLQLGRGEANGVRLFSDTQSRTMWTPHIMSPVSSGTAARWPSTHFIGYGLGWSLRDYLGHEIVMHGGAYDGMYSQVLLVPEERLGLVILTNAMTSVQSALAWRIVDAYLGAPARDWSRGYLDRVGPSPEAERWAAWRDARASGTTPSLALEAYAGTFGGPLYGNVTVALEDGKLVLRLLPAADLVGDLTHWHRDVFRVHWRREFPWFGDGLVQFVLNAEGDVDQVKIDVPNGDFWFTELELRRTP